MSTKTIVRAATLVVVAAFLTWVAWGYFALIRPLESPRMMAAPPHAEPPPLPASAVEAARNAPYRVVEDGGRYWIKDKQGRVVILRGVGVGQGSKIPPFLPLSVDDDTPFRQLRGWGVNAIRYAVPWEALEPKPGAIDEEFLAKLGKILDNARANGILVLLDLHQDMFSRCFSGDGAPIWAIRPGLVSDEDLAKNCMYMGWLDIMNGTRQMKAWADFWMNDWTPDEISLQDHLINAWMKVVERFRGHPALLGYNLLNEPYGFYGMLSAIDPLEGDVESKWITPFYRRFATRIRGTDATSLISFEPTVRVPEYDDWFGMANTIGPIDLPNLVWAPHFYDIWQLYQGCDAHYSREKTGIHPFLVEMQKQANEKFRSALVLAEFGVHPCKTGADADLLHQMTEVEDAMIGSFLWNYFVTGETWGMTAPREGGEDMSLVTPELYATPEYPAGTPRCSVRHFVRPYPIRIAGLPVRFSFDRSFADYDGLALDYHGDDRSAEIRNTGRFELELRETGVRAPTLVFVPRELHFPNGALATLSDGTAEFLAGNPNILAWTTDASKPMHRLTIDPLAPTSIAASVPTPEPAPAPEGAPGAAGDAAPGDLPGGPAAAGATPRGSAASVAPDAPAAPEPAEAPSAASGRTFRVGPIALPPVSPGGGAPGAAPSAAGDWYCDPGTRPKK